MGLQKHGKGDWRNISRNFVISKTPTQVASHAQKYFMRQNSGVKDHKRRPSIHDITTVHLMHEPPSQSNDGSLMVFGSTHGNPFLLMGGDHHVDTISSLFQIQSPRYRVHGWGESFCNHKWSQLNWSWVEIGNYTAYVKNYVIRMIKWVGTSNFFLEVHFMLNIWCVSICAVLNNRMCSSIFPFIPLALSFIIFLSTSLVTNRGFVRHTLYFLMRGLDKHIRWQMATSL